MTDATKPFAGVTIETSHAGRLRTVTSVREAATVLLFDWPDNGNRGPGYRAALRACHDALDGMETTAAARLAFIRAAQEVDIFVRAHARKG